MDKLKRFVTATTILVWANIILWLYEIFFTLSVWGCIPGLGTHFGAGLGDLVFTFMTAGLLLFHTIGLLVFGRLDAKKISFTVLFIVCLLLLTGLHEAALRGNFKGYESAGNAHGLYYDRLKK